MNIFDFFHAIYKVCIIYNHYYTCLLVVDAYKCYVCYYENFIESRCFLRSLFENKDYYIDEDLHIEFNFYISKLNQ